MPTPAGAEEAPSSPSPSEEPAPPTSPENDEPSFADLGLDEGLLSALETLGFEQPTPIQRAAIEPTMAGKDIIARARTGSGKTAAFGLPLLHRLATQPVEGRPVRALILAPTRELALQVTGALRSFATELRLPMVTIYGGASYGPQLRALGRGVPIVVGTPGRVLDHMERGTLDLSSLEMLVLDEADEMLRMGFVEDVERVLAASPADRQVALFSATMPDPIRRIAETHLRSPVEVEVEDGALTTAHVRQRWMFVPDRHKTSALLRLLAIEPDHATLIFARTRASCAELAEAMAKRGMAVDALHGDLAQAARERVLARLRSGQLRLVVATDVAARGIDVEHLDHVINYDLPSDAESYVHRIGRTARAGREGWATSLVTPREVRRIRQLSRLLQVQIEPYAVPSAADIADAKKQRLMRAVLDAAEASASSAGTQELATELSEGQDAQALLRGALSLLAATERLDLDAEPDTEPPSWAKRPHKERKDRRDRPDRPDRKDRKPRGPRPSDADWTDVFVPLGRSRGVRAGDLVGAFTAELQLDGGQIGRVTIHDHVSFVQVEADAAERVLTRGARVQIRGKKVEISQARPQGPRDGKGRGKGKGSKPWDGGGRPKRKKFKKKGKR